LDVALGSPRRALHYLRLAYRGMPHEVEVAGSYAHALARAGEIDAARQILRSALGDAHERADDLLEAWLRATPTQGV
jgi:Flp pilus assembly protein TadD